MPCEYAKIALEQIEKQQAEEKKKEIEKRKKALIMALGTMGFELSLENIGNISLIKGKK